MISEKSFIPVLDIFAGPGGLGEGFSSFKEISGGRPFQICLSIEKDINAYNTLKLRGFFRKFQRGDVPEDYYALKYDTRKGNFNFDELYEKNRKVADEVESEVYQCEMGNEDVSIDEIDRLIRSALERYNNKHWILIGGPPCQAYSTVGRSRNKGNGNYVPEKDHRHFLYREYLRIISRHWPSIFVMENVKGILTSKINKQPIFSQILSDLKNPAEATGGSNAGERSYRYRIYSFIQNPSATGEDGFPIYDSPYDFIIESEKFGIPQARHRVILLGIREDLDTSGRDILCENDRLVTVQDVLDGLPKLRSGLSRGKDSAGMWQDALLDLNRLSWLDEYATSGDNSQICKEIFNVLGSFIEKTPEYDRGGETVSYNPSVIAYPDWYLDRRMSTVFNSTTRGHLIEDLYRYLFCACFAKVKRCSPVLMDFPKTLLPKHKNADRAARSRTGHFADRFRVQYADRPATTVMSHISKDGHYYIHPDPTQCRSMTVREAARLQTFPDNYIFTGSRTQQYVQVGNAVPPLLAKKLAAVVFDILQLN